MCIRILLFWIFLSSLGYLTNAGGGNNEHIHLKIHIPEIVKKHIHTQTIVKHHFHKKPSSHKSSHSRIDPSISLASALKSGGLGGSYKPKIPFLTKEKFVEHDYLKGYKSSHSDSYEMGSDEMAKYGAYKSTNNQYGKDSNDDSNYEDNRNNYGPQTFKNAYDTDHMMMDSTNYQQDASNNYPSLLSNGQIRIPPGYKAEIKFLPETTEESKFPLLSVTDAFKPMWSKYGGDTTGEQKYSTLPKTDDSNETDRFKHFDSLLTKSGFKYGDASDILKGYDTNRMLFTDLAGVKRRQLRVN